MMSKLLSNISSRTVRSILDVELNRPVCVAPKKPYQTETMKARRVVWLSSNLRRKKITWESVLFVDEVMFEARDGGRG